MVNFTSNLPENHGKIIVSQKDHNQFRIYQEPKLTLGQRVYHVAMAILTGIISLLFLNKWDKPYNLSRQNWRLIYHGNCEAIVDCNFLDSKKIISGILKYDHEVIKLLSEKREFTLAVNRMKSAPDTIQPEKIDPLSLQFADPKTKKNKKYVLDLVAQNGLALEFADPSLQRDEDVVMKAVQQNGNAFKFANQTLQINIDIILAAIGNDPEAIAISEDRQRRNIRGVLFCGNEKAIVLLALKHGIIPMGLVKAFLRFRDVALAAVAASGLILKSAPDTLKKDPEIVKISINQNGLAIQYAHDNFKLNLEYVLDAVKQNGLALQFVGHVFKADRKVVLEAVRSSGMSLKLVIDDFKKDREIVKTAVLQDPRALQFADITLKSDQAFMLELVKVIPFYYCLIYGDKDTRRNKEFVLAAIEQYPIALKETSPLLKRDPEVVLKALRADGLTLQYVGPNLKKDPKIVAEAVKQNPDSLQYADPSLQNDVTFQGIKPQEKNSAPINLSFDSVLPSRDVRGIVAEFLFNPTFDADGLLQLKKINFQYHKYEINFAKINELFQLMNWIIPDNPERLKIQIGSIANINYKIEDLRIRLPFNTFSKISIIDGINNNSEKVENSQEKIACRDLLKQLGVKKEKGIDLEMSGDVQEFFMT